MTEGRIFWNARVAVFVAVCVAIVGNERKTWKYEKMLEKKCVSFDEKPFSIRTALSSFVPLVAYSDNY